MSISEPRFLRGEHDDPPLTAATTAARPATKETPNHPVWVRVTHWLNALATITMMLSGWRIYDASPIFRSIEIPASIKLGGWLGGALQWHFAAMWLLVANVVSGAVRAIKRLRNLSCGTCSMRN